MLGTLALTVFIFVTVAYLVSLYLRDASIMDIFWGVGFILIAAQSLYIGFYNNLGLGFAKLLATALIIVWGIRITLHIALRHNGEDARYAKWRSEWGSTFAVRSYVQIFILQGALMLAISSGLWLLNGSIVSGFSHLLWWGLGLWLLGFLIECVADLQLAYFRSQLGNRGKLLMTGLWQLSRHPNYFGEALQWWGLGIIALSTGSVSWKLLLIGPVVITFLLRFVSGVPLLEEHMRRNPQYAHYAARTNAFFPWFPR